MYLANISFTGDGAHLYIIICVSILVVLAFFGVWRPR